ncbi:MAG: hypothetical protein LBV08_05270 [Clostridiales bacterium]|jgi:hypothetical protein|nr:hypothetical protein [Clostridiales bacterium]
MNNKINVYWVTHTAVFIALLIVMQMVTAPLGNTLVTGSIVNLLLIISVMVSGYPSGLAVAVISPALAKFFGIGPLWGLIPFIVLGNITLVSIWYFIAGKANGFKIRNYTFTLVVAAVAKFLVLYIGIVRIALPFILNLPEQQSAVISGMFSIPQLFTALVGGATATAALPLLKNALSKSKKGQAV